MSQPSTHRLIATTADPSAEQRLKVVYDRNLIAPEKKPFLADLRRSSGPYLATESGELICDAASQIASLGLGFNAGALFGTAHYLESWTGRTDTESVAGVRQAFTELLQRKLASAEFSAHFTASGAETVETALGFCWQNRSSAQIANNAKQVLAFEGSFHGRMMVSLASTWNPKKREPFAWPGFESKFAPYPEMDHGDILAPQIPDGWRTFWAGTAKITDAAAVKMCTGDPLLERESDSLLHVHRALSSGKIFAVIIEPRQCEGGDRFSSARFHNGLINLCRAHDIPLVYDEVQTGFGLGGEFFWHRLFDLRDATGAAMFPDHVVCAKKAQTGIVLSRSPDAQIVNDDNVNVASMIRGYIQASMLDQFQPQIEALEKVSLEHLNRIAAKYDFVTRPRGKGLSLALDLDSPERVTSLIKSRFDHGLLFYQAGATTIRFRMNLSFRESDVRLFWNQLDAALASVSGTDLQPESPPAALLPEYRDPSHYYQSHQRLVANKIPWTTVESKPIAEFVLEQLPAGLGECNVVELSSDSYPDFRSRILAMQSETYEPARQTSAEEFDALFQTENPLAILLVEGDSESSPILAMAFAGAIQTFPDVRGRQDDPHSDDPSIYYMLDLTVAANHRGSLGRIMKQALLLLAQQQDHAVTAIHGRNRDRSAAGMWAINLSLGSFQIQHLEDDYPDQQSHRDCIYYRSPIRWNQSSVCLSSGITSPLGTSDINSDFIESNLPALVNKTTLSNFVTRRYLDHLQDVASIWPERLRHFYTTSGQSECVDKIVKVLWKHRAPRTKLISIDNSFFGSGSFMARSLSGIGESFFEVQRFDQPSDETEKAFLADFKKSLTDDVLGVFIEPVFQRTMEWICPHLMENISDACNSAGVPWVCNDTAGMFYRFNHDHFAPSVVEGLQPDFFMAFLGGQMGIVGCTEEMFLADPLLLISTWDGDAFSLARFHHAATRIQSDPKSHTELLMKYHFALTDRLNEMDIDTAKIGGGIGWFRGELPGEMATMFRKNELGNYVSCASPAEMLRYLDWDESQ